MRLLDHRKANRMKTLLVILTTLCALCNTQGAMAARVAALTRKTVPPAAAPRKTSISFAQRLFAGGASRALAQMTLYPIDALRTLAQTRDGRTLADVGVGALVRGSTTTSFFALFMGSLQFSIFGACRDKLGPLLASALGAAGSCIVSVPQEVIKQRLVTGIYPSFRAAVSSIAKNEGFSGFYSAWKPTMARNVPFVMITFTAQDYITSLRLKKSEMKELSLLENVAIGMGAALIAGVITNPVDVVKTRMMTQAASNQAPYTSVMDCFLTILRSEGPLTFYSGFKQRSTYMCLLWGMTFALNGHFQRRANQQ